MGFLERMREKPHHVKGQYAFISALAFTLVVALIWGLSLPARLSNTAEFTEESKETKTHTFSFNAFLTNTQTQIANLVNTIKESMKAPEETSVEKEVLDEPASLPETDTPEDSYTVATSSGEIVIIENDPPKEATSGSKIVLIATTSKSTATSSKNELKTGD